MKISSFTTVIHDIDNILVRDVPVTSTVVEFAQDLAIIDTGMPGNPELEERLGDYGYNVSDFTLVFNTHLHPDHIGGNHLFTNARILVSKCELLYETHFEREFQESSDPAAAFSKMGREIGYGELKMARDWKKLSVHYRVRDLVGDQAQVEFFEDEPALPEGIMISKTAGHSIDSRALMIQGERNSALVTGDALFHRDLWKVDKTKVIHHNVGLYRNNAKKLAIFKGIIIPGHDRPFENPSHHYLADEAFYL